MIIIEGDETTFWKNIFQNSCRKYLLKVENEKKKKQKKKQQTNQVTHWFYSKLTIKTAESNVMQSFQRHF